MEVEVVVEQKVAEWMKAGPSGAIRAMASAADKDGAHRRLIEDGQESWFWIRGAKGSRSLRAADIGFSDIRKPAFFSRSPRPRTFTFCFPVNIPSADAQGHSLGDRHDLVATEAATQRRDRLHRRADLLARGEAGEE